MKRRLILCTWVLLMTLILALSVAGCGRSNQKDENGVAASQAEDLNKPNGDIVTNGSVCSIPKEKTIFTEMDTVDMNGEKFDSSFFKDHIMTVVNVWSVDCAPCIEELPILEEINQKFADRDVAVVGLLYELGPGLSDRAREEAEEILADAGVTYRQLITSEAMADSEELQSMTGFPTTFFVDSYGQVLDIIVGAQDYTSWDSSVRVAMRSLGGA